MTEHLTEYSFTDPSGNMLRIHYQGEDIYLLAHSGSLCLGPFRFCETRAGSSNNTHMALRTMFNVLADPPQMPPASGPDSDLLPDGPVAKVSDSARERGLVVKRGRNEELVLQFCDREEKQSIPVAISKTAAPGLFACAASLIEAMREDFKDPYNEQFTPEHFLSALTP